MLLPLYLQNYQYIARERVHGARGNADAVEAEGTPSENLRGKHIITHVLFQLYMFSCIVTRIFLIFKFITMYILLVISRPSI